MASPSRMDAALKEFVDRENSMLDHVLQHVHSVKLNGLFAKRPLQFEGDSGTCKLLEERYRLEMLSSTRSVIFVCLRVVLGVCALSIPITWSTDETSTMVEMIIGLAGSVVTYSFMVSRFFWRFPHFISVAVIGLGLSTLVSLVLAKELTNLPLTLLMVALFTTTPLGTMRAAAVACIFMIMTVGYRLVVASANINSLYQLATLQLTDVVLLLCLIYTTGQRDYHARKTVMNTQMLRARAVELAKETDMAQGLLESCVPAPVAEELRQREGAGGDKRIAKRFAEATVLFVAITDFGSISNALDGEDVVEILNLLFSELDALLERLALHKVESIGSTYMVVGGCPVEDAKHPLAVAFFASQVMLQMPHINRQVRAKVPALKVDLRLKVGINSGPLMAGVVGERAPRYKLFGDTVNMASRMTSTCEPGRVQCSPSTSALFARETTLRLERRGEIPVKGKGIVLTHYLDPAATFSRGDATHRSIIVDPDVSMRAMPAMRMVVPSPSPKNSRSVAPVQSGEKLQAISAVSDEIWRPHNRGGYCPTCSDMLFLSALRRYFRPWSAEDRAFRNQKAKESGAALLRLAEFVAIACVLALLAALFIHLAGYAPDYLASNVLSCAFLLGAATIIIVVIRTPALLPALPYVLLLCFVINQSLLVRDNYKSEFPNVAFMITSWVVFFTMELFTPVTRLATALLAALANQITMYVALRMGREYKVLLAEDAAGEGVELDTEFETTDVLKHSFYLALVLLINASTLLLNERLERHDFAQRRLMMKQGKELDKKKDETSRLLCRLLPPTVVPRLLAAGEERIVDKFQRATVLFTDVVGFTQFSSTISALSLMEFLHEMYCRFDAVSEKYGLYKVEIIGDAYFVVGGCPVEAPDHTERVLRAALEILGTIPALKEVARERVHRENPDAPAPDIAVRVGVHVGPVLAGIVGYKDPRYHVFGATVTRAESFESTGVPGRVHVSQCVVDAVSHTDLVFEPRPGCGEETTYLLVPR